LIIAGEKDHITLLSLFKNNPSYLRKNISINEIPRAGHYPWLEHPNAIVAAFTEFVETMAS
jgi:pimeloyl-ACP methyl ester carboxylesterase